MNEARAASLPTRPRGPALFSAGGLILVVGPPIPGQSILAARLADMLHFTHKLEVVDNLAGRNSGTPPTGTLGENAQSGRSGLGL